MKLQEQEFAEVRDKIYPLLMDPAQIQEKGQGQMLNAPVVEGLFVIYGVEEPGDKIRYVTYQDLRDWGVSHSTVHVTAVNNLGQRSQEQKLTRLAAPGGGRPMYVWHVEDGYDAARILLADWLDVFARAVEGNLVLGVPHRNWLVALGDSDPDMVAAVRRRVIAEHRSAEFPVSPYIYTWDGRQLGRYKA